MFKYYKDKNVSKICEGCGTHAEKFYETFLIIVRFEHLEFVKNDVVFSKI